MSPAEIAVVTPSNLELARPITSGAGLIALGKEIQGLVSALVNNVDYGMIPGAKTPVLLKPGAEKLALAFGAHMEYVLVSSEAEHDREVRWSKKKKVGWDKDRRQPIMEDVSGTSQGLYRYVYKCRIIRADGRILGEAEGSCSTMESKYVDRPRDMENTVIKMAQKRAMVAAALHAFGLSNRFTQDVEDSKPEEADIIDIDPTVYDNKAPGDRSWLKAEFERNGTPQDMWKPVAQALDGKRKTELDDVIAFVGAVSAQGAQDV